MKLTRREFLQVAASAASIFATTRIAWSQAYPSRPARVIVGDAAGGAPDIVARVLGQWLSERMGQSFVIENRPGAGSNIATEAVVRSAPDGYTLLIVSTSNAINSTLYNNVSFNLLRDIEPAAPIVRMPLVMVVNPSFPAKTVQEFITHAKANAGKLNMASAGNGSAPHVAGELFKMMAGVDMVHVPHRGGPPALTAVLGGQVDVYFVATSSSIENIKASKLRALAVTTGTRWQGLPDVPALNEVIPGYEASIWFGLGAPKDTPPEIVDRLNKEINAALADPKVTERLSALGGAVIGGSQADFGKLMNDETEKWAKVIQFAGIKAN